MTSFQERMQYKAQYWVKTVVVPSAKVHFRNFVADVTHATFGPTAQ